MRPDIFFLGVKYDGDIVRKSSYSSTGVGDLVIDYGTDGYYSAILFVWGYSPYFLTAVVIGKGTATKFTTVAGKVLVGSMNENKIYYSLNNRKIVIQLNKDGSQAYVISESRYNTSVSFSKSAGYDVSEMTELTLT